MFSSTSFRRSMRTVAAACLVTAFTGALDAQRPGPVTPPRPVTPTPRSTTGLPPRPALPAPNPGPSRRDSEVRKKLDARNDKKQTGSSSSPATGGEAGGGAGAGSAPVGAGAGPAAAKVSALKPAEIRAATKSVDAFKATRKSVAGEFWSGVVAASGKSGTEGLAKFALARRFDRDGSSRMLVRFERRHDLPQLVRLVTIDADGRVEGQAWHPEEKRLRKEEMPLDLPIAGTLLTLADLTANDLLRSDATLLSADRVDSVMHFHFAAAAKTRFGGRLVDAWLRQDVSDLTRLEIANDKGDVERRLDFRTFEHFGVHRRSTSLVVREPASERSATVILTDVVINPDMDEAMFTPEGVSRFLTFTTSRT